MTTTILTSAASRLQKARPAAAAAARDCGEERRDADAPDANGADAPDADAAGAPSLLPPPPPPSSSSAAPAPATISLPGYGMLYFHQLGQLAYLRDRGIFGATSPPAAAAAAAAADDHDDEAPPTPQGHPSPPPLLEAVVASSAGALAAVLMACGVCPDATVRAAHALCERAGLYSGGGLVARALRPAALVGRLGGLLRGWLDELLPADAHARAAAARCSVAVTRVGWGGVGRRAAAAAGGAADGSDSAPPPPPLPLLPLRTERLSAFGSRDELIEALAASAHVPLFMDGRLLAATRRGGLALDGSLLHLIFGAAKGGLVPPPPPPPTSSSSAQVSPPRRRVIVLDPFQDPELRASGWGWLRCLALPSLEGALALAVMGRRFAARLEAGGAFEGLLHVSPPPPAPVPLAAKKAEQEEEEEEEDDEDALTVLAGAGGSSSASLASLAGGGG